jgi:hypothetical protein
MVPAEGAEFSQKAQNFVSAFSAHFCGFSGKKSEATVNGSGRRR